jgi:ABC-type lipoprotein release transport system permease subunit
MELQDWIFGLAGVAFTAGVAAAGAVKLTMNGLRAEMRSRFQSLAGHITRVEGLLDHVDEQTQENRTNIASILSRCYAFHGTQNWPTQLPED